MLSNLLPKEGSLVTIRALTTLRDELPPTPEEVTHWQVEDIEGGGVRWDNEKAQDVEIEVPIPAAGVIAKVLEKLNADEQLTPDHLTLCEKFLEGSA